MSQSPLVGQSPFVGQSPIAVMSPLVNPYDFRRAQNAPVAMTTYVNTPASEIFGGFKGPKMDHFFTFHFTSFFTSQKEGVATFRATPRGQSPFMGQSTLVGHANLYEFRRAKMPAQR